MKNCSIAGTNYIRSEFENVFNFLRRMQYVSI